MSESAFHAPIPLPIGALTVAVGGIVAQVAPTTNVGAAGLIASVAGLLMAGFQYFKAILDARQQARQIQEQSEEIRKLKEDLAGSRQRRHDDANRFSGLIATVQYDLIEAKMMVARLEGQLGQTDKSHASAINANSDNILAVAEQTGTRLPGPIPHVEPIELGTDDDIEERPSDGPR